MSVEARGQASVAATPSTVVRADDLPAVAKLVRYPLTLSRGKSRLRLGSATELLAHYGEAFNDCVLTTIKAQRIGRLFCRDQGVMYGNGALWVADATGGPKIVAINGGSACKLRPPPVSK